jgi:hypothetical protein
MKALAESIDQSSRQGVDDRSPDPCPPTDRGDGRRGDNGLYTMTARPTFGPGVPAYFGRADLSGSARRRDRHDRGRVLGCSAARRGGDVLVVPRPHWCYPPAAGPVTEDQNDCCLTDSDLRHHGLPVMSSVRDVRLLRTTAEIYMCPDSSVVIGDHWPPGDEALRRALHDDGCTWLSAGSMSGQHQVRVCVAASPDLVSAAKRMANKRRRHRH